MKTKIIAIILILIVTIGGWFFFAKEEHVPTDITACTEEAKICPDGSSVGREGPNCEFSACPSVEEEEVVTPSDAPVSKAPVEWITHTDPEWKYSFEYPSNYTLTKDPNGYKVTVSPPGVSGVSDFYSVFVIQYPEVDSKSMVAESLFNVGNLPDGNLAWLKDPKIYKYENYKISSQEIVFGKNKTPAIENRENSINNKLGEYRRIIYVLRDPAIYRVTYDLVLEKKYSGIIKRISDSFTVIE